MNDSVKITIKGKEYEIPFPNVGQYYTIECLKEKLSNGTYGQLILSNAVSAVRALDMIDIEATLTVLCPQILKDLKVDINKLGLKDYKELQDAYVKTVVPFFRDINKLLS